MSVLDGVHPDLIKRLVLVYAAMSALGRQMRPTDGVRTLAQQQALYAQGRTAPGKIVTNADGINNRSNHQAEPDGYGHAVDSCFVGDDPYLEHDPRGSVWWATYGQCVRAVGLMWGGDFHTITDQPHAELPGLPPSKGVTLSA